MASRTTRCPRLIPILVSSVLVALLGAPTASPSPSRTPHGVQIMTYNIHSGADEADHFDVRRTAAAINAAHPDIVGLQEVDRHWAPRSDFIDEPTELARLTGMHVFFAPIYSLAGSSPTAARREFGVAILSRTPLWLRRNLDITRLSTQGSNPHPALAPGFATAVTVAHGVALQIYCTHLDFRPDPSVRAAQVRDMIKILDRSAARAQVLVGDMNAPAQASELAPLHRRLHDAWTGPGGATYPVDSPRVRIDQILTSRQLRARDTRVELEFASDHRPVSTTIDY